MARNNSPPKTFPKKIDKYDRHPERINEIFNEKRVVTEIIANFMNMFLQTNFNSNRPYYQNSQNRFLSNDHFFLQIIVSVPNSSDFKKKPYNIYNSNRSDRAKVKKYKNKKFYVAEKNEKK